MMYRILVATVGLLCSCSALRAAGGDLDTISIDGPHHLGAIDLAPALSLDRPDLFSSYRGSLLIHSLPVTTLLDGRRFPISGNLNRMGIAPLDSLPLALVSAVRVQPTSASPLLATDAPGGVIDFRTRPVTSGGEAGVFYGGSGGKFGREDFSAYLSGGVGTEKLQISASAVYQNSSGHGRVPNY